MAVTIEAIALLAGVSRGTVDRVLHGRPNVSAPVRAKVLRAAETLGYHARNPGGAFRATAAILIPKWTDGHFNRKIISGIRRAQRYINDSEFCLIEQQLETRTAQEMLSAARQQVQAGVDGLILRAENTPEVRMLIEYALSKNIQIVTYDADIPESGRLCYAGQDLWRAGAIAAGVMARLIRPPEHVLVVTGNLRLEAHKGRVDGFCRRLRELGFGEEAYRIIETNEMRSVTEELVAEQLDTDPYLRAIYMATQSVSGCMDGIRKSCRRATPPHVICNDLTPTAKRYLQEGKLDYVIGQAFDQESYFAILAMYQMLIHHQAPAKELYYTDLNIISQEML